MDTNRVYNILNNDSKCDVFYNSRAVWIQEINQKNNMAKIGFVDNFEEQDVNISDLYE